jgi:hypothetical protein
MLFMRRAPLTIPQILSWADAFYERTGTWPTGKSGRVWEPPDEKWANINQALHKGLRGLNPGQTLAKVLAKHRGKRNRKQLPTYTITQILVWVDEHHTRTGRWPHNTDGPIPTTNGETWFAVDMALRKGLRGMPGGSSLAKFLAAKRRVPNRAAMPKLTTEQILDWADRFHRQTGNWPTSESGPIPGSQRDSWRTVDKALRKGSRGLRKSSLAKLLLQKRGVGRHARRPPLTIPQILVWADDHYQRMDRWPKSTSGPIATAPGDTWGRINEAYPVWTD